MNASKRWVRRSQSANNFDLVLANPEILDRERTIVLLDAIQQETHRGLSLSARADKEFRRWANRPDTPLKSEAYVLLSNWFLTQSGDRHSMVAVRCEELWDELFPCRPDTRLSSSQAGRNHLMLPEEFESFWRKLSTVQGDDEDSGASDGTTQDQDSVQSRMNSTAVVPSGTGEDMRRTLTIGEAKAALALTFGVSPDKVEITIRG
jgi:hypothetical protein